MSWRMIIPGILIALIGGVWFFQGIGQLLGSPMTNQPFWAVAGAIAVIVGIVLAVLGVRRGRTQQ